MPKKPDAYHRPENLAEALRLLAQPDVVPLGGGTKLLASESGVAAVEVVDLQALGLNQVEWRASGKELQVGATAKLADVAEFLGTSGETADPAALLHQAIHQAGANTYRHAATLGGSIAARLPGSELVATLLVLEAILTLYTPDETSMAVADYLAREERPSGLITTIHIPWSEGKGESARVARTPVDEAIVSVTCWQPQGEPPRLAATGIAPRPLRLAAAEAALASELTPETIQQAAATAKTAVRHPGDFRGDTAYRAEMVAVLTRRALAGIL